MSSEFDRSYFDAKFDGLKDLMVSQNANLTQHIGAVSRNVKDVSDDLADHKESISAHGIEVSNKSASAIVAWLGLGLAGVLGALEIFRGHKP